MNPSIQNKNQVEPIHIAALKGHLGISMWNPRKAHEIVNILLHFGASIHTKDDQGRSPLHYAVQAGIAVFPWKAMLRKFGVYGSVYQAWSLSLGKRLQRRDRSDDCLQIRPIDCICFLSHFIPRRLIGYWNMGHASWTKTVRATQCSIVLSWMETWVFSE